MKYLKRVSVLKNNSNEYPFNIELFKEGFELLFDKKVTIIIGENGCGKSTIMKKIAKNIGFNIFGGNSSSNYADEQLNEDNLITMSWSHKTKKGFYFRSDTFDTYYNYIESDKEISRYYPKKFSKLSHGESFLELFNNFNEGIFLLDEPESALSPQNQLGLLRIIYDLEKNDKSQIIILTHSPIIMSYPNADLFLIDNNQMKKVDYKETNHYTITKTMLENPEKIYKILFEN